jgi:hypothetical protein
MENAGPVSFIVAGAMLLTMAAEGGVALVQLRNLVATPPSSWASQANSLPWEARLFGIAAVTAIMSFFSSTVATAFAGLAIAYYLVYDIKGVGAPSVPSGSLSGVNLVPPVGGTINAPPPTVGGLLFNH